MKATDEEVHAKVVDWAEGKCTPVQFNWWMNKWEISKKDAEKIFFMVEIKKTWRVFRNGFLIVLGVFIWCEMFCYLAGTDTITKTFLEWLS